MQNLTITHKLTGLQNRTQYRANIINNALQENIYNKHRTMKAIKHQQTSNTRDHEERDGKITMLPYVRGSLVEFEERNVTNNRVLFKRP